MSSTATPADVLAGNARWCVVEGDAAEVLRTLPDGCAHVTYCDPAYGLASIDTADVVACLTAWLAGKPYAHNSAGFMGHEWDSFVPGPDAWREVHRVLKPGAYCVAFSSTRTVDLLGIAVRLAGFEMREGWAWNFSAAMPKSLNVGKAIDREAGAEREVIGQRDRYLDGGKRSVGAPSNGGTFGGETFTVNGVADITAPATPAAAQWEGYGTAVKPAYEPLIVARKPFAGTVAENVQRHGCGALNIDAGRIGTTKRHPGNYNDGGTMGYHGGAAGSDRSAFDAAQGRFPAALALVHSEGCELVGTTRVATGSPKPYVRSADASGGILGREKPSGSSPVTHADADGMETCDEWVCVDGCAVAELARQSGAKVDGGACFSGYDCGEGNESWNESASTAARFSSQDKASSQRETGGSALPSAAGIHGVTEASPTRGDTFTATEDGIASGESRGAATSTGNSKAGGCGRWLTDPSQQGARSITSTTTQQTTESRTSDTSRPRNTGSTTSHSEPITESVSAESKSDDASGARNTNRSTGSTDGRRGPSAATASNAARSTFASGSDEGHSSRVASAARFFFNAKAASSDRLAYITCSAGCAHHETVAGVREARATARDATQEHPHGWCVACGAARHHHLHSTVKPLDLARYHARLLSLPSHVDPLALVPFCGSGPEARALLEMGFRVIAVDLDPRHCAMTRHRLSQPLDAPQAKPARKAPRPAAAAPVAPAAPPPVAEATPLVAAPSRPRGRAENAAQLSLFAGGAK